MGALHLRPPVCPYRSPAGRSWHPRSPNPGVDSCCHGRRTFLSHGLQSVGRRQNRCRQSSHPQPRHPRRPAFRQNFVFGFTCVAALIFVLAAAQLNRLTLYLSPLVLVVLLGYSYLKRITRWSHIGLGLALGLAPSAAWIAVRGSLDPRILVLTAAVTLWVGGFDVLYACQDFEHDRVAGLHSLPQAIGIPAAFWAARATASIHAGSAGLVRRAVSTSYFAGWLGIAAVASPACL